MNINCYHPNESLSCNLSPSKVYYNMSNADAICFFSSKTQAREKSFYSHNVRIQSDQNGRSSLSFLSLSISNFPHPCICSSSPRTHISSIFAALYNCFSHIAFAEFSCSGKANSWNCPYKYMISGLFLKNFRSARLDIIQDFTPISRQSNLALRSMATEPRYVNY